MKRGDENIRRFQQIQYSYQGECIDMKDKIKEITKKISMWNKDHTFLPSINCGISNTRSVRIIFCSQTCSRLGK